MGNLISKRRDVYVAKLYNSFDCSLCQVKIIAQGCPILEVKGRLGMWRGADQTQELRILAGGSGTDAGAYYFALKVRDIF
jgi:hypothetical protein